VKEKFDKEFLQIYYSPGAILYLIKLANRNFPIISQRLKANGVPDDFKYLCIAESNMQSWAVSSSGAVGYWQFLQGTGAGYGLEISSQVDQRQDLEKATDAACQYFKTAYAKFGNWTAAAASYNCGMGGYNSQASFQRTTNYYDLQLPEETNKYIFRILTFKYLIENANELGFNVTDEDKYQSVPTKDFNVTSSIPDLAQFAINNGTTYKMLRVLNPWLKGKSLTVSNGRNYVIKLPAAGATALK
jgi:membrane-bound lytic murein transglycosylase D